MKAHELAKKLLEGPNVEVIVDGYESGMDVVVVVGSEPENYIICDYGQRYYGLLSNCEFDIEKYASSESQKKNIKCIELVTTRHCNDYRIKFCKKHKLNYGPFHGDE